MNKQPLVSVIITTYNRADLLPRAIGSVLNQTYQNFELIIVDDGSIDNTEKVVKSFDDRRVIYHRHEKNKGVLAAKNTGFDLVKGEYFCFLDDDDELLPEALETGVSKMIELSPQEVKIVRFDAIDAETGRFSGSGPKKEGYISYEDLLCGRVGGDYWGMMHKDYIGDNRFDESLWAGEGILWLRLHRQHKGYYVPKVLYKAYRRRASERLSSYAQILKHIPRIIVTRKVFLQEYGEELEHLCPRYYGERLALLGYLEILNGDKLTGRKTLRESFKFNSSLKHRILYFLSFILNKNQLIALSICYVRLLDVRRAIVFYSRGHKKAIIPR